MEGEEAGGQGGREGTLIEIRRRARIAMRPTLSLSSLFVCWAEVERNSASILQIYIVYPLITSRASIRFVPRWTSPNQTTLYSTAGANTVKLNRW